jgi:hypothetical protein
VSELLLPLARAARRFGVPQAWLKNQADAGLLPCLHAGNRRLFNIVALEAALAALAERQSEEVADDTE